MGDLIVVGLTGGIGSGKSTVAELLARRGCVVVDADGIVSDLLDQDCDVTDQVGRSFGVERPGGGIERGWLAGIIFESEWARKRLEMIVHPKVAAAAAARIEKARRDGASVVVYDVALLVETWAHRYVDVVVVVTASLPARVARLGARGLDKVEVRRRMDAQISDTRRCAFADHVLINNGDLVDLERLVDGLWRTLTTQAKASAAPRKETV